MNQDYITMGHYQDTDTVILRTPQDLDAVQELQREGWAIERNQGGRNKWQ